LDSKVAAAPDFHDVQPCQALCDTIPGQFRNFQIYFVEQHFGRSGRVGHLVGQTKLPSLLQERLVLSPRSADREFYKEESHACASRGSRHLNRPQNAVLVAAGTTSVCISDLLAVTLKAQSTQIDNPSPGNGPSAKA
jgi:hypothetical protein